MMISCSRISSSGKLSWSTIILTSLILLLFILNSFSSATNGEEEEKVNLTPLIDTIDLITKQCNDFSQIENLSLFVKFYEEFNRLTKCSIKQIETSKACQLAEEICEQNKIIYSNVKQLVQLIYRFESLESVCTIEYSSKLFHLHNQLATIEQFDLPEEKQKLLRILRSLGNSVATRCRKSLPDRLEFIEKSAPHSIKHVGAILVPLNIDLELLEKMDNIGLEHYAPILESEQQFVKASLNGANSIAKSFGYQFKLTQQVKIALESVKFSCNALKMYHTNLIGSLGLLASVGYAPEEEEIAINKTSESKSHFRIKSWLISAILCQSIGGVLRISEVNAKDETETLTLKVYPIQEAEVSSESEDDTRFGRYPLPELKDPIDLSKISTRNQKRNIPFESVAKINLRKQQLINGPNLRLANAIYSYLDLKSRLIDNRAEIPYKLLGLVYNSNN